jgi:ribose 5-phosphate isomerase B
MKVYIGSDHRGFHLKEKIAKWLFDWGYKYEDIGAQKLDPKDDYPKYASEVASLVVEDKNSLGIVLCGSGVGVDVVANKFNGVRAGTGIDSQQIREARADDNINILVIAADHTSDDSAKEMIKVFLETKFDEKTRHKRRLEDIRRIEENN